MPDDVDFSRFVHADSLDSMTTDRLVKLALKLHEKTDMNVEVAADEDAPPGTEPRQRADPPRR